MAKVKTLLIMAPGTNCDFETQVAFEQAGAEVESMLITELLHDEKKLFDYHVMVIPGGFTYGDDVSAGKILANQLKLKLSESIRRFVADGRLIMGICNGFQVLVKAGILPDLTDESPQAITLAGNDSGKFECRWVYLRVNENSPCVFTRGINHMYLPVAHGEGKLVTTPAIAGELNAVVYYADDKGNVGAGYPSNPNGSVNDIAGICDPSGRIFALMPHPERFIRGTQHPRWPRKDGKQDGDGLRIFQNAVAWAKSI